MPSGAGIWWCTLMNLLGCNYMCKCDRCFCLHILLLFIMLRLLASLDCFAKVIKWSSNRLH